MASQSRTIAYLLEQMAGAGSVSAKRMFGECGLYLDGKMFALVCDDRLFMKPTAAGRAYAPELAEGIPYPGSKPCLEVGGDRWDDAEWLVELARCTAAALPMPKPKKPKGTANG